MRFGSVSPQGSVSGSDSINSSDAVDAPDGLDGSDRETGASPAPSADIRSFCKASVQTALVGPDDDTVSTADEPDETPLDEAADELYALLPQDFTDARNARAKAAKSAGDRELASAIGALRKPSTGAWVVNLLARERADLVDQLLELGDALRSAQETLSGPELRALSAQRHRVVASVVTEARKLAASQGVRVSDSIERELESTFDAALADPRAADAVRSGRLVSALSYAGLGSAPPTPAAPPEPRKSASKAAPKRPPAKDAKRNEKSDDEARQRKAEQARRERAAARQAAEQALREAEQALEEATQVRDDAAAEAADAADSHDEVQRRIADLQTQLERAEQEAVEAAGRVRETGRAAKRSERAVEQAQRHRDAAQAAVEKLPPD